MNLVQIAEDLKGLPMQALQAYMNGTNPSVPPYLAAGELQRRQAAQKAQSLKEGAAQGPMPSVKDQIEQAANSMVAQQQRQAQGMQQMAQQAQKTPMPVPQGTPKPEAQAQPEGGLAALPVRSSMFRAGGVVGYADGGAMSAAPGALEVLIKRRDEMRKLGLDTTKLDAQIAAMQPQAPEQTPLPTTTAGIQQLALQQSAEAARAPAPTEESQIAAHRKFEDYAGMPDYMKRLQALDEKYAESTKGRGLENLMRGLAAEASGRRGSIGLSAAETAAADRAADLAHAKTMAEAYGGLSQERMKALTEGQRGAAKSYWDAKQAATTGLGHLYAAASQADVSREGQASNERIQKAYAAQSGVGARTGDPVKDRRLILQAESANLARQLAGLKMPVTKEERDKKAALQQQFDDIQAALRDLRSPNVGGVETAGADGAAKAQSGSSLPPGVKVERVK